MMSFLITGTTSTAAKMDENRSVLAALANHVNRQ